MTLDMILSFLNPEYARHPDSKLNPVQWLGNKIIRACFNCLDSVFLAVKDSRHNDWQIVIVRVLTNTPAQFETIHTGHQNIEQSSVY